MGFEIFSGSDRYRFGKFEWRTLADYSRHVAPRLTSVCRHWYTNDGDGLNANLARQLGAELQRSVDTCSIDDYARQLFAVLCKENSVPDFARYEDGCSFDSVELPKQEQERRFVDEFIREIQRFIEFLLTCKMGFAIL